MASGVLRDGPQVHPDPLHEGMRRLLEVYDRVEAADEVRGEGRDARVREREHVSVLVDELHDLAAQRGGALAKMRNRRLRLLEQESLFQPPLLALCELPLVVVDRLLMLKRGHDRQ